MLKTIVKNEIRYKTDCVGSYFVSGYTKFDETDVRSYIRRYGVKYFAK